MSEETPVKQPQKGDIVMYVCKYDIYNEGPSVLPAMVTRVLAADPEKIWLKVATTGGGFDPSKPIAHDESKALGTWHWK